MNTAALIAHKTYGLWRLARECRDWPKWLFIYFASRSDDLLYDLRFRNGAVLRCARNGSDVHIVSEIWLYRKYDRFGCNPRPNDIVVDLGANIGVFSSYAATVGKARKVYAYEAHPGNYARLVHNAEATNTILASDIVSTRNQAVWSTNGTVDLQVDCDNCGAHSIVLRETTAPRVSVPAVTLSEILAQIPSSHCDLLKIDIEGAEYDVLAASRSALSQVDRIVMEHHRTEHHSVNDAVEVLKSCGFAVTVADNFLFARQHRVSS